MTNITNEMPIAMLTVGQLREVLAEMPTKAEQPKEAETGKRYVYGLRGIRQLFKVSHATAQKYKDTIIKDAVTQCGRKIMVDADLALKLFDQR